MKTKKIKYNNWWKNDSLKLINFFIILLINQLIINDKNILQKI